MQRLVPFHPEVRQATSVQAGLGAVARGAGDSFAGGFIGYLAKTKDVSFENMKRAVIYGSVLASFCVEKFGTEQLQSITKEQINCRLQNFVDLVKFDVEPI